MGRPPLPVGQHGNISFRTITAGKVRAMAYVRDADGRRREVTAHGTSRSHARSVLQRKIAERTGAGADIGADTRLAVVAAAWIADIRRQVADGARAPNTLRVYEQVLRNHVLPAVGELRVREATVPRMSAFITTMRAHHRASITASARTVLNGILGHAVRAGAIPTNPMRDVTRVAGERRPPPRVMTQVERDRWLASMDDDVVAVRQDLPDLCRLMLGTGVRVGEALALDFADVDIDDKTIAIDHNLVRIAGDGLHRMATKTTAGERTLRLPGWAVDLLIRRGDERGWRGPVFPSRRGTWRDESNTLHQLRGALDRAGFGWVTSHVFRKTVATVLDESGLSAREIADHLGHAKVSMTQDVYMGRKARGDAAAVALETMFGADPECAE